MDGIFSTVLNIAAAAVGVPVPIGSIAASGATPGYAQITQTPDQIAKTVAPKMADAIAHPSKSPPDQRSLAVAQAAAPQIAQAMAAGGYVFAPGTLGAQLQSPNMFNAFGGSSAKLAEIGFAALGVLLLVKLVRS